jgi:hypothetical protein
MANEKINSELDELAFRIYAECVSRSPRAGEQLAIDCYRRAETFLVAREKIRNGTASLAKPDTTLSDCRAPNQPKNFPLNLVSQAFGNLSQVNRIAKWLEGHPPTDDDAEFVGQFKTAFPEHNWPMPEINRARVLFPNYVKAEVKV